MEVAELMMWRELAVERFNHAYGSKE